MHMKTAVNFYSSIYVLVLGEKKSLTFQTLLLQNTILPKNLQQGPL